MGLSLPHLIILALVVLLLFGRGKLSELMGDFGKGVKSFKEGIGEGTNAPMSPPPPPAQITVQHAPPPAIAAAPPIAAAPIAEPQPVAEPHGER